jgi:hypothetical protein
MLTYVITQIPYFIAFFFLEIPGLTLEIAIGQAYRGGPTVAYDHVQKRLKGIGFSLVYNGYMIVLYYVPILAWVMAYFRRSFSSPLPWEGNSSDFYMNDVIRNGERTAGEIAGGSVQSYSSYAGSGMVGVTVGWCAFTWFLVWLCIWRGIGQTGRVVYFVSVDAPVSHHFRNLTDHSYSSRTDYGLHNLDGRRPRRPRSLPLQRRLGHPLRLGNMALRRPHRRSNLARRLRPDSLQHRARHGLLHQLRLVQQQVPERRPRCADNLFLKLAHRDLVWSRGVRGHWVPRHGPRRL